MQDEVAEYLKTLSENDIIEEKDSTFISPAFIIKKKNRKLRLVVDYRYLNSITQKTHQFTPNMFELMSKIKQSKVFSTIDLNQVYYQIQITEDDVDKTDFKILNLTFVFKRMPFGLCNAPETFQKTMNTLFKNVENIIIYLDYILIYSQTIEDHYETLNKVFEIMKHNNISVNFEKSEFFKKEIEFLGHIITEKEITQNYLKLINLTFKYNNKTTITAINRHY
ncbi:Retrovirus-related Pol polyprotein from transposon 17.6 [Dictyocoela roeselum]|nr:Retrovirus-related Pol polyprotein from transposon 17.6 [Dictyocoela roeselum]